MITEEGRGNTDGWMDGDVVVQVVAEVVARAKRRSVIILPTKAKG